MEIVTWSPRQNIFNKGFLSGTFRFLMNLYTIISNFLKKQIFSDKCFWTAARFNLVHFEMQVYLKN